MYVCLPFQTCGKAFALHTLLKQHKCTRKGVGAEILSLKEQHPTDGDRVKLSHSREDEAKCFLCNVCPAMFDEWQQVQVLAVSSAIIFGVTSPRNVKVLEKEEGNCVEFCNNTCDIFLS